MKIWIINPYGNLPNEGWREYRSTLIAEAFAKKDHEVVWWVSNFEHRSKKFRSNSWKDIQVNDKYLIKLVPSSSYTSHISLARIKHERNFANNFRKKIFESDEKPDLIIIGEPALFFSDIIIDVINKKKIPLILLNARITKKTFKRWIKIKKFARSIFNNILISYPQNQETKFYLEKLGSKKIIKIGNLKFVENNFEKKISNSKSFKSIFQNKKVWVASSTHKDEEIFCAKAHIELKKQNKNLITIIIPRHVHRVKQIVKDIQNLGLSIAIHSSNKDNLKGKDIYIVDTFGETKKFHELASSVFLGGSIISRGGQNPLEAARSGARILHGPNIDNFKDVYKLLKFLKISIQIRNPKKLASLILFKKDKYKALKIKKIGRKIFNKTVIEIDNLINNEFKKT